MILHKNDGFYDFSRVTRRSQRTVYFQLEFRDKAETGVRTVEFRVGISRAGKVDGRYLDIRHSNEAVQLAAVSSVVRKEEIREKARARALGSGRRTG